MTIEPSTAPSNVFEASATLKGSPQLGLLAALAGLLMLTACQESPAPRPLAEAAPWAEVAPVAEAAPLAGTETRSSEKNTDELVIMTWNVEFLWDGVAPEDGDVDFPWKGNRRAAEAHMAAVAAKIRQINPDILSLAEVENLQALETLRTEHLRGLGYKAYLVEGSDTATGQDVGLLSRVEIRRLGRDPRKGRSGSTRKAVSKHYVATAEVGSWKLGLVGLHLLARPERHNRVAAREAQADALLRMARELQDQGRELIVWGDFNDYDGQTLDRDGSRPITRVLSNLRAMDPRDPGDDLINVTERLPRQRRFTVRLGGRQSPRFTAIDHILLSPALASRLTSVDIPQGSDWRDASDHFPVVARLKLN